MLVNQTGTKMTGEVFKNCIHPRQFPRLIMAVFFAVLLNVIAIAAIFLTFGILLIYALLIVLFVWITLNVLYASFVSNSVLVSDRNYPRIAAILAQTKQELGFNKQVHIFVYQQGEFNAAFRRFFARRAIFMNSELLDMGVTDREIKWIIARFVGQVKVKHKLGPLSWVIALAQRLIIFNLFILPYERATAYTGDRLALATIDGDINSAVTAFNKLLVGRQLGYSIDPSGIIQQNRKVKGSFFAFLARIGGALPHTISRYVDLIGFAAKAFPDRFRQFAAENPSLQPMVGASGGRADLSKGLARSAPSNALQVSPRATEQATLPPAVRRDASYEFPSLSGGDAFEGEGHWGWLALPIGVFGFNTLMFSLLFRMGMYEQAQIANLFAFGVLIISTIFAWVAFAKKGPKPAAMSALAAMVIAPIALAVLLFGGLAQYEFGFALDQFIELDVLNPDLYLDGIEDILDGSYEYLLSLGFVTFAALLREFCLRGFVLGGMIKNGAGLISVGLTSAMLDMLLVLATASIAVIIELTRMFDYGLDWDIFGMAVMRHGSPLIIAAITGLFLGLLRALSGRIWPGMLVSVLAGIGSMLILNSAIGA